jgi:hypothetical protein
MHEEEKAKVTFASTLEVAQLVRMLLKLRAATVVSVGRGWAIGESSVVGVARVQSGRAWCVRH